MSHSLLPYIALHLKTVAHVRELLLFATLTNFLFILCSLICTAIYLEFSECFAAARLCSFKATANDNQKNLYCINVQRCQ